MRKLHIESLKVETLLAKFDQKVNKFDHKVGPVAQAEVLGISYRQFATYRAGAKLPARMRRHIQVILLLPDNLLRTHLEAVVPEVFGVEDEL